MPSIEAPTHYENADGIAPGRVDDFLKWIDPDYYIEFTGETEAPTGYVALLKITPELIAEYASSFGEPWITERRNFGPGWYILRFDDNGLVWGMSYGGFCELDPGTGPHNDFCADTFEETKARQDFKTAEAVYHAWLDADE